MAFIPVNSSQHSAVTELWRNNVIDEKNTNKQ